MPKIYDMWLREYTTKKLAEGLKEGEVLVRVWNPHEPTGAGCLVPHENGMPCGPCKHCGESVAWDEWDQGCIGREE